MKSRLFGMMALSALTTSSAVQLAKADTAIVFGPATPGAKNTARNLKTAQHDAQLMAQVLKRKGFNVKVLTGSDATKSRLQTELAQVGQEKRTVVYLSTNGTRLANGQPALMMADTVTSRPQSALSVSTLGKWLASVPSQKKAIILDAHFAPTQRTKSGKSVSRSKFQAWGAASANAIKVSGNVSRDLRRALNQPQIALLAADDVIVPPRSAKSKDFFSDLTRFIGDNLPTLLQVVGDRLGISSVLGAVNGIITPSRQNRSPIAAPVMDDWDTPDANQYPIAIQDDTSWDETENDEVAPPVRFPGSDANDNTFVTAPMGAAVAFLDQFNSPQPQQLTVNTRFVPSNRSGQQGVAITLRSGVAGWLFLFSYDSEGDARMLRHWGNDGMSSAPNQLLELSRIGAGTFQAGRGQVQFEPSVATEQQNREEIVKAILFTERADAQQFLSDWQQYQKTLKSKGRKAARNLRAKVLQEVGGSGSEQYITAEARWRTASYNFGKR